MFFFVSHQEPISSWQKESLLFNRVAPCTDQEVFSLYSILFPVYLCTLTALAEKLLLCIRSGGAPLCQQRFFSWESSRSHCLVPHKQSAAFLSPLLFGITAALERVAHQGCEVFFLCLLFLYLIVLSINLHWRENALVIMILKRTQSPFLPFFFPHFYSLSSEQAHITSGHNRFEW